MLQTLSELPRYFPDAASVSARFRFWHVEALLNQSADLIDRCLEQLREAQALDLAWNKFRIELDAEKEDLALDVARAAEGVFERDVAVAERRLAYLDQSEGTWNQSSVEAGKVYKWCEEHDRTAAWSRAGQVLQEKAIEGLARKLDYDLTTIQRDRATADGADRHRRLVIRQALVARRSEMSVHGGPFSLDTQRALLLERLSRDYEDAFNRAYVAEEGLRKIYGYIPIQEPVELTPPGDELPEAAISHVAQWIRNAIEWLVATGQLEQAATRVVSLRALVGEGAWTALRAKEALAADLEFSLPPHLFAYHRNVRLRGIAACLQGKVGVLPWTLVVKLPKRAAYVRDEGIVRIDQSDLPACILGRVENQQSVRAPELCGQVSLANASPLGSTPDDKWAVEIVRPTRPSNSEVSTEEFDGLADILMEVSIVGVPLISREG